jgi:hypothetical protein
VKKVAGYWLMVAGCEQKTTSNEQRATSNKQQTTSNKQRATRINSIHLINNDIPWKILVQLKF